MLWVWEARTYFDPLWRAGGKVGAESRTTKIWPVDDMHKTKSANKGIPYKGRENKRSSETRPKPLVLEGGNELGCRG